MAIARGRATRSARVEGMRRRERQSHLVLTLTCSGRNTYDDSLSYGANVRGRERNASNVLLFRWSHDVAQAN